METYRGYLIEGQGVSIHPVCPEWKIGGAVYKVEPVGSVLEVGRFELAGPTFDIKEVAAWFGLELARMFVDECLV